MSSASGPVDKVCGEALEDWGDRGPIFVGYSGGLDSTALLHAVMRIHPEVVALHVDHGLQPESVEWRKHCEKVCRLWGVELMTRRTTISPGANVEARAREQRYGFFSEVLDSSGLLMLAHHADDQVETVLLHLLQGRGAYGMPAGRSLAAGELRRPLLTLSRETLERYIAAHSLAWIDDSSNEDARFDRNFLRNRILPELRERFPQLNQRVESVTRHVQVTQALLGEQMQLMRNPLPVEVLAGQDRERQVAVLRLWLECVGGSRGVRDSALAEFARQLEAPVDRQPLMETSSGTARRHAGALYFVAPMSPLEASVPVTVPGTLTLSHGVLEIAAAPEGFSTSGEVHIRSRRAGDRLMLRGQARRVGSLLAAAGLPPWERARYPLVVDDLGVAAIPGIADRDPEDSVRYQARWTPGNGQ